MKTITVKVGKKGETTIEGHGFEGPSCQTAIDRLKQAIGQQVGDARLKPEFYQVEVNREEEKLG